MSKVHFLLFSLFHVTKIVFGKVLVDSSSLGFDEFQSVLSSELDLYFSSTVRRRSNEGREAAINAAWQNILQNEWDRGFSYQNQKVGEESKIPFLVCHKDGSQRSGWERLKDVTMSVKKNKNSEDIYFYKAPLYNNHEDGTMCIYASMAASFAELLLSDSSRNGNEGQSPLLIQPLPPQAKIRVNSALVCGNRSGRSIIDDPDPIAGETSFEDTGSSHINVELAPHISSLVGPSDVETKEAIESLASELIGRVIINLQEKKSGLSSSSFFGMESWDSFINKAAQADCSSYIESKSPSINIIMPSSMRNTVMIDYKFVAVSGEKDIMCQKVFMMLLSHESEILSIEKQSKFELQNDHSQWILQSNCLNYRPLFDLGLTGKGQVIQVSDDGLDVDHCYFKGGDIVKDGSYHPSNRKVVQYVDFADALSAKNDHGSHVSGTLAGRRSDNGVDPDDGMVDGVAKDAKISFFDVGILGTTYLTFPPDLYRDMIQVANVTGSKIHSASWATLAREYNTQSEFIDEAMSEDHNFLFVGPAGNYGPNGGEGSVVSTCVAKNGICVGAVKSYGSNLYPGMPGRDHLWGGSGRGPTCDGRIKPDVLAPGVHVLSVASQPSSPGACDTLLRPSVVLTNPISNELLNPNAGLRFSEGTSMSVPAVAGSAAIVRQYFEEGWYPYGIGQSSEKLNPSGALVKAVLLNGAQPIIGVHNSITDISSTVPYDNNQGFGRVNLLNSLPLHGHNNMNAFVADQKNITTGEFHEYEFSILQNEHEFCTNQIFDGFLPIENEDPGDKCDTFSATLVWTERQATPGCARCVENDLDLLVTKTNDSSKFYPNGKNSRDSLNTAERVRTSASIGDNFVVRVTGTNLATEWQSYSLVVTGCFESDDIMPPTLENSEDKSMKFFHLGVKVLPPKNKSETESKNFLDIGKLKITVKRPN